MSSYARSPYQYNVKETSGSGPINTINAVVDNVQFFNIVDNVNGDTVILNNSVPGPLKEVTYE